MADADFQTFFIGTVLKVDEKNRQIGVYIPKLMCGLNGEKETEYIVPTNTFADHNFNTNISNTVKKINYIWVKNWNYDDPMPKIGSKVSIFFIDGNITLGYWKKFNPNNDYDVIESEKYHNLFELAINDKHDTIKSDDTVTIKTPDYFDTVISKNDKNITIALQEKYNFFKDMRLVDAISQLQKSMSYLETEYEKKFLFDVSEIEPLATSDELKNNFDICKQDAIIKIKNEDNLLDSGYQHTFFVKLLNGLNTAYKNYSTCKTLLKTSSSFDDDTNLKTTIENDLDSNITTAYTNVLDNLQYDMDNLNDYLTTLNVIFNPEPVYKFHYYSSSEDRDIVKNISCVLYSNIDSIESELNKDVTYNGPLITQQTSESSSVSYKWKNSYGIVTKFLNFDDIDLYPVFLGFGIDEHGVTIINDENVDLTIGNISLKINGEDQSNITTIDAINSAIKETENIASINISITINNNKYTYNASEQA